MDRRDRSSWNRDRDNRDYGGRGGYNRDNRGGGGYNRDYSNRGGFNRDSRGSGYNRDRGGRSSYQGSWNRSAVSSAVLKYGMLMYSKEKRGLFKIICSGKLHV